MYKKLMFLFMTIFLLTGCHATANIVIENDTIEETIKVSANNNTEYSEIKNWSGFPLEANFDDYVDNFLSDDNSKKTGVRYYNVVNDDINLTTTIKSSFDFSSYMNSSIVNNCFEHFNIFNENNKIIFSTSKGLTCNFYDFNIVVSTPYLVVSNNADKVNIDNNTYTWSLNKNNLSDFGVYLEVDLSKKYNGDDSNISGDDISISEDGDDKVNDGKKINSYIVIGLAFGCFLIFVISFIVLKNKKNKASKL